MGFFSFVKNEFIETIDWVEDSSGVLLYKFPDKGNKIMNGARLTVRESQLAILVNEGEFGDVYSSGLHRLTTKNMPVITTLASWKYLFDSPFKVDVFFFNTAQFIDLKWGTQDPILIEDRQFKQVRVRARGIYSVRITDPKCFITEFGLTDSRVVMDDIEGQLRHTIINKLSVEMGKGNISLLEYARNYENIAKEVRPVLSDEFKKFGLELVTFFIENVGLPAEVESIFDKVTQMQMVGNLKEFTQFQTAVSLEKAAEGEGTANAFVGMAAGMNFQSAMNKASVAPENKPETTEDIMALIQKLAGMKDLGVLTDEEFIQKKTELLKRI